MNNEETTDTDGWPREEPPDEQCCETKREMGKGKGKDREEQLHWARSVRDHVGAVVHATRRKPANYTKC
ncbi:hypothetical protein BDN71DRAFT_1456931 [Pleurotus eryngii]|uniref:Uncharacterized protein n=1 Tax=Pleurotus eryngii TaxID=5323 RepID=A0A9P6D2N2_PLEER|nr:hypothetical protein BDN71DRAFT_1456931 [Pleurotus eryngii]